MDSRLLGRRPLLERIETHLQRGTNVLLVGPEAVGKSALIRSFGQRDILIVDPFEGVHSRLAARILRALDRGAVCVAAATTLDRAHLGAVRRIAWRFEVVRVPPLSRVMIRRLVFGACARHRIPAAHLTTSWVNEVVRLADGLPGVATLMVDLAAAQFAGRHTLPSASVAYINACVSRTQAAHARRRPVITPSEHPRWWPRPPGREPAQASDMAREA